MTISEKLAAVAENQPKLYDTGFAAGQQQGFVSGYDVGYAEAKKLGGYHEGYSAGQQAEYDRFWDAFQQSGERENYQNAFVQWDDVAYNPKYSITGNLTNLMQNSTIVSSKVAIVSGEYSAQNAFYRCQNLVTIESLDITSTTNTTNMFYSCPALVDITFVGEIKLTFGLPHSNLLSDTSVQSIIDHLADLTGQTAQTLTLHKTVGGKLTDAQKAVITAKNWALVY